MRFSISDTRLVREALSRLGHDPAELGRLASAVDPGSADRALRDRAIVLPRAVDDPRPHCADLSPATQAIASGLLTEIAIPLRARAPATIDLCRIQGLNYYEGPLVQIVIEGSRAREGSSAAERIGPIPIGDGGATRWLEHLLSDRNERFVCTGIGSELVVRLFDASG